MAKLNGVTTVSERIQYNGAEYVKSDEAAVVGDIVRFDDTSRYATTDAFYEVTRIDSYDDPQIIGDDGDEFDLCGEDKTVFKRVEAAVSPITDGKVYVPASRKAVVGDKIIVTQWIPDEHAFHDVNVGEILTVKEVTREGKVRYVEERHISAIITVPEYSVLVPKVADSKPQPQYREVKRKANVGERIRIVRTVNNYRGFSVGDEFTVNRVDTDGSDDVRVTLGGDSRKLVVRSEYAVLEPVKKAEEPRLKVGEYAKITGSGRNRGEFSPHKFAIGDIVKVTCWASHYTDRVGCSRDIINGVGTDYYVHNEDYIRATDAEVAEAKRKNEEAAAKAAEEAKWAKIGRKVGEFKAGDLVRVKQRGSSGYTVGLIDTVSDPKAGVFGDCLRLSSGTSGAAPFLAPSRVELIAPVESLFNR